ncbi:MAG: phosphoribosyl-AMP cyclohydrolase [Calditrichaeota bacterium]|nr:MAG: phosphoribosyl-AMP cyclohydrolase [Calditrichota bacterium]
MLTIDDIKFDDDGLIPVIVQDFYTKEVLMMAYMNRECLEYTITEKKACYFSRSTCTLWIKGETNGHYQYVKAIKYDCDGDTLLLEVDQVGNACRTGHRSCFFRHIELWPECH